VIRRRDFITLLGGATAWPLGARAQPQMPVVGFLNGGRAEDFAPDVQAFIRGLKEVGLVDGQNVTIEYRWANGQYVRLPAMAAELVHRQVNVIAANGPAALPAKSATATIPIVFRVGGDPVQLGLVASLNRPGGNVTGVSALSAELEPKRLELLHEVTPQAMAATALINPTNSNTSEVVLRGLQTAARALGLQLHVLNASNEEEIDAAFATAARFRTGGLVVGADAFFSGQRERIAALAIRYAIPTIYQFREFAAAGGLMSYGGSVIDQYRLFGMYAGRVLKGGKPADLPVQQSTKIELIINLKTAKALGISFPLPLLGRADEIIE
jgi:putative tryptophan/tyrosine transport system substrate-binding protein